MTEDPDKDAKLFTHALKKVEHLIDALIELGKNGHGFKETTALARQIRARLSFAFANHGKKVK